jgi:hypothetical protein
VFVVLLRMVFMMNDWFYSDALPCDDITSSLVF